MPELPLRCAAISRMPEVYAHRAKATALRAHANIIHPRFKAHFRDLANWWDRRADRIQVFEAARLARLADDRRTYAH